jgi:lipopolysaccharide export system permease protein
VLAFATPLVIVIAALSFLISPWAASKAEQYRSRLSARDDLSRVEPGAFGESRGSRRVYFVEAIAGDQRSVRNVFINTMQHQRSGVMMSSRGYVETAPSGDRYLVLVEGRRYEGTPGSADFRVMEFERYATRIETKEGDEPEATQKSLPTMALLETPTRQNLGEFVWRVGIPLSALILALLAIPLSFVNPRAGRSVNLLFALLAYMTYSNLISVSQARVTQGKMGFLAGLGLVHLLMLAVLILLFAHRQSIIRVPWRRK